MYIRAFGSKKKYEKALEKMSGSIEKMNTMAKKLKNKKNLSLFIVVEVLIYEGVLLIAKPERFYMNLFADSLPKPIKKGTMKFINQINDQPPFKYNELQRDMRLGINVWCVDSNRQSFCIGSAGMTLFTQEGFLKQGEIDIHLWPLEKFKKDII